MNYLCAADLIYLGILQEANRLFFHPLGLALEVSVSAAAADAFVLRIQDQRDDPEGMIFGEGVMSAEKAARFRDLVNERHVARIAGLGFVIQRSALRPDREESPEPRLHVTEEWHQIGVPALPVDASSDDRRNIRTAFYAGADGIARRVSETAAEDMPLFLRDLKLELDEYYAACQSGRPGEFERNADAAVGAALDSPAETEKSIQ
ncbi:MAG TPA: hypothetical protein VHC90_20420 [Bryobacteraceae bacterium]|nr:hypothetical protein [Bryobacteraceae bacterium]